MTLPVCHCCEHFGGKVLAGPGTKGRQVAVRLTDWLIILPTTSYKQLSKSSCTVCSEGSCVQDLCGTVVNCNTLCRLHNEPGCHCVANHDAHAAIPLASEQPTCDPSVVVVPDQEGQEPADTDCLNC